MAYLFLRLLTFVAPRIPFRLRGHLAVLAGLLAWLVARSAREGANKNAMHVLGLTAVATPAERQRLRRIVQGMFITNARNYLESCALPVTSTQELLARTDNDVNILELGATLALGKGAVVISAHFGPFDYLAQCLQVAGYPLTIPVEQLKDERMLELMLSLRRSHGVQYVPLNGMAAMRTLLQQLREKHSVLITADRAVQGQSMEMPFFGAKARLPLGPVSLALRTGAPLVGAFGWYGPDQRIYGEIVPITLNLPEEQRNDQVALMHAVVKTLEHYIGAHPQQWSVFSPIWVE